MVCTSSACSNFKARKEDSPNAFQNEISNFKLLVTLPNDTEAGKTVSATERLLLLKSKTIFQAQRIWRYILANVFQPKMTSSYWQTAHVYARSIRYAIEFQQRSEKGLRKLQRATQSFQGAQVTYGYLLDRADHRQSDQFSNSDRKQA